MTKHYEQPTDNGRDRPVLRETFEQRRDRVCAGLDVPRPAIDRLTPGVLDHIERSEGFKDAFTKLHQAIKRFDDFYAAKAG